MGGSVGVTVRETDGKEHRMCRWTNSLPWFVSNIRLLHKDRSHVAEYLKTWDEMKADYDKHRIEYERLLKDHNGNISAFKNPFEFNMTPCYAPYPFLAPQGYGLVVVDMVNDVILSSQGYSNLGKMYGVSISYDMLREPTKEGDLDRFREFFNEKRIKSALDYRGNKAFDVNEKSLSEIEEILKSEKMDFRLMFDLDMSPYTIIKYEDHGADSAKEMMQKVQELGFVLTDEEKNMWGEWINDYEE